MNEKIDIHRTEKNYKTAKERLKQDNNIIPENKEIILRFLYDCEMGKTIKGKARTKIGNHRLLKYLIDLKRFSEWFNKPFNEICMKDVELVIYNLENNIYKIKIGASERNYSEETKIDYKKVLKEAELKLLNKNLNSLRDDRNRWAHGIIHFKQEKQGNNIKFQSYLNYINSNGDESEEILTDPYFDNLTAKFNTTRKLLVKVLVKRGFLSKDYLFKNKSI